jgi:hypothetical protein
MLACFVWAKMIWRNVMTILKSAVVLIALSAAICPAVAGDGWWVNADVGQKGDLKIRKSPSPSSPIVKVLRNHDPITLHGDCRDLKTKWRAGEDDMTYLWRNAAKGNIWCKVLEPAFGWVNVRYVNFNWQPGSRPCPDSPKAVCDDNMPKFSG